MFVGVKMAVCLKGGFNVFMAQPVSNQQGGEAFFNEKGSVGMPKLVGAENTPYVIITTKKQVYGPC